MCVSDSAAAVLVIRRRCPRSNCDRLFSVISDANIVGTPGNTVTCSRTMVSSTFTGKLKLRSSTTVAPSLKPISTWYRP